MSQRKGSRGEIELLEIIRARWPLARRMFRSGACGGGDIDGGPAGYLFECKRTERLRLRDAWAQAALDAYHARRTPIVATRWNEGPWLAVVELDELLELIVIREGMVGDERRFAA